MDHKGFVRQMISASASARQALDEAALVLEQGRKSSDTAAARSENAAEYTAKCAFMVHGIDPVRVHDLMDLARNFNAQFPDHEWVAKIQQLNGKSVGLHHIEYGDGPDPELLENSIHRASGATQLHLEVLRAYAQNHPEHLENIRLIAESVRVSVSLLQEPRLWHRLPLQVQHEIESWTAGVSEVEERARSASLRQVPDRILFDDDPDQSQGLGF